MPNQLRGHLDLCDNLTLRGWACNTSSNTPVKVEITLEGLTIAQVTADLYRKDLEAHGIGNGEHAFEVELSPEILKKPYGRIAMEGLNPRPPLFVLSGNQAPAALEFHSWYPDKIMTDKGLQEPHVYFYLAFPHGFFNPSNIPLIPWFIFHFSEHLKKPDLAKLLARWLVQNEIRNEGKLRSQALQQMAPWIDISLFFEMKSELHRLNYPELLEIFQATLTPEKSIDLKHQDWSKLSPGQFRKAIQEAKTPKTDP